MEGRCINLKTLTDVDVALLRQWDSQDSERLHTTYGQQTSSWLCRTGSRLCARLLGITVCEQLIGAISLEQISWSGKRAELRVFIGPEECRGRGYGTDAVGSILRIAFDEMGLNEVYLRVKRTNLRAIACYRKCGFRVSGRLSAGRHRVSGAEDLLLMTVSRERFERIAG